MSLKRKFGLTESELIALNPKLREGIKLDSEIWVPKDRYEQAKAQAKQEDIFVYEDSNDNLLAENKLKNVHHIAYVLPFRLRGNKSENDFSSLKQKLQDDKLTKIAADFYLGARIAIDSLSKKGYRFKVEVLDSDASIQGVNQALRTSDIENAQVIIGPFLPKVFNALSQSIKNPSTALLVPMSNSSDIELRPNVYQTIPNSEYQKEAMIDYIGKLDNTNILVVSDGKNQGYMQRVVSKLSNARLVTNINLESLKSLLSASKSNIVIVDSNDLVFLSELTRNLHALQTSDKSANIRLVALERGSAFDGNSLSNTQLSTLYFTYPTVNKFSGADNSFSKKYEKEYGMLPNRYVVRGFDMTMDALLRLGISSDFKKANEKLSETSQIENKFIYKPNFSRGGGFENKGVYIVEYNNLEIKELQ